MLFYPADAPVPETLRTEELYLEMLAPKHVERDYDAFMSSIPRLQLWSGGSWPSEDFTLAQNMDDMVMHSSEHLAREAFTYTVLNPDQSRCEGCIYINPWSHITRLLRLDGPPEGARDFDGITTFWVRESALAGDLDRQLLGGLQGWFTEEWAFDRMLYLVNRDQTRDAELLDEAGLARLYAFETTREPGLFYVYGPTE